MQELQALRIYRVDGGLVHLHSLSRGADADATQTSGACEDDKPLRPASANPPRLEGPVHAYTEK